MLRKVTHGAGRVSANTRHTYYLTRGVSNRLQIQISKDSSKECTSLLCCISVDLYTEISLECRWGLGSRLPEILILITTLILEEDERNFILVAD